MLRKDVKSKKEEQQHVALNKSNVAQDAVEFQKLCMKNSLN